LYSTCRGAGILSLIASNAWLDQREELEQAGAGEGVVGHGRADQVGCLHDAKALPGRLHGVAAVGLLPAAENQNTRSA